MICTEICVPLSHRSSRFKIIPVVAYYNSVCPHYFVKYNEERGLQLLVLLSITSEETLPDVVAESCHSAECAVCSIIFFMNSSKCDDESRRIREVRDRARDMVIRYYRIWSLMVFQKCKKRLTSCLLGIMSMFVLLSWWSSHDDHLCCLHILMMIMY